MDVQGILVAGGTLGAVGAVAASVLAAASRAFRVDEDPRIGQVTEALPGANCGGCGYPGCSGYAAAVVAGKAAPDLCAPGGVEAVRRIGAILGIAIEEKVRMVAVVRCGGGHQACPTRFHYAGVRNCKAVTLLTEGGSKGCPDACEGLGDCVEACLFDAIHMGPDGLPIVDRERCTACGQCVKACPKGVMVLEPCTARVTVACHTRLAAREVRKVCSAGCISCRQCVKVCPYEALAMKGNLPVFDHSRCVSCGLCIDACKPGTMAARVTPDPAVREQALARQAERKAEEAARKAAASPAPAGDAS